jgi:hypothetical protein
MKVRIFFVKISQGIMLVANVEIDELYIRIGVLQIRVCKYYQRLLHNPVFSKYKEKILNKRWFL